MDWADLEPIMKNSIVKTGLIKNTSVYGRPEYLELSRDQIYSGVNAKNDEITVYNLKQAKVTSKGFKSYVCDYKRGEINYQILSNEADYCFTITMNGCTFGIGAPNSKGDVLVTHGNQAGARDGAGVPKGNQTEKQLALAKAMHGDGGTFLTPDAYRPIGKANATTFGVRDDKGSWKFYYQSYTSLGNQTLKLNGLHEIKASSKSD